jgi:hypothetical protein
MGGKRIKQVNIYQAKAQLSKLVDQAAAATTWSSPGRASQSAASPASSLPSAACATAA